ncbi:MAG TPA: hypothetical protein VFA07_01215 [Chthonomonadaceae bacterium]|nr:hypothetical protein [Chthonomonadaceae bacterium]
MVFRGRHQVRSRSLGRALILLAVALGSGLLVFWLAAPRFLPSSGASAASSRGSSGADSTSSNGASASIPAPLTAEQKQHNAIEAQRAPFYGRLRGQLGDLVSDARPAADDQATLLLYAQHGDEHAVDDLLAQAVQPDAFRYGFRHVRFYLPNPPGNLDKYRFAAEANADDNGVWQAFYK